MGSCAGSPRTTTDIVSDSFFAIIFSSTFVLVLLFSIRSFKQNRQMVNSANISIVTFLLLTLLNRVLCLLYSLIFDCNQDIQRNTVQMWFYFELPIAFINAATIVMFFEWTQFAYFIYLS